MGFTRENILQAGEYVLILSSQLIFVILNDITGTGMKN
jgi:hypothetical protein